MRSEIPKESGYKAKDAYQEQSVVYEYDDLRFKSLKGRITDALEKRAVLRALACVSVVDRILDIPCGTGRITHVLLQRGYSVVAGDISETMLEAARSKLNGFENLEGLDKADAENLQYNDDEFDVVTSIRLMNHVPPKARVQMLREMARVSRGAVIASYCNPNSLSGLKRRIKLALRPSSNASWHPATRKQVKIEAEQAGLRVSAVFPIMGLISETNVYLLVPREDGTTS